MGICPEFGAVISEGCDHRMRPEESSCVCPGCGTRCQGLFNGCPDVWAARTDIGQPAPVAPPKRAVAERPVIAARVVGPPGRGQPQPTSQPPTIQPLVASPVVTPEAVAAAAPEPVAAVPPEPAPAPAKADQGPRKAKEAGTRLRAEAETMREEFEQSFERMAAELADRVREIDERAREIEARAREIDDRAAAHLRTLDHDRLSVPSELRKSVAGVLPGMVAEAVRIAMEARRSSTPSPASLADDVRQSLAAALPELVADAVDLAIAARPADLQALEPSEGSRPRSEHDPIVAARQRSVEKRLDGLTRRAQEIDDRVTTHLRAIDDDRAALSDLTRRQDELTQSIADAATHHQQLVDWVNQAVPGRVADAVQTTLEAHAATVAVHAEGAKQARTDTQAMATTIRESSELMMETLYRRDQEIDDRAAAHLGVLEDERAALAALLDGGRDQVAQAVIGVMPAIIDAAVRSAMERHATERRAPLLEMVSRLRADSDTMRESLQRSFEKMMDSLATRDQELEERAAAHTRTVEHERGELAALRVQVAASLTEALPVSVAEAVGKAEEQHRAQMEAARADMERLRAESEAATAELRETAADMRAAMVAQRAEAVERQAAASERALAGLRSAVARPVPGGNGRPRPFPASPENPSEPTPEPMYELETSVVVEQPPARRVVPGRSPVPRARRVERRMLKIDDSDDSDAGAGGTDTPWRPLDRRQAVLSDLLDEER